MLAIESIDRTPVWRTILLSVVDVNPRASALWDFWSEKWRNIIVRPSLTWCLLPGQSLYTVGYNVVQPKIPYHKSRKKNGCKTGVLGILSALQRCLFESPINICDKLDARLTTDILDLLENISRLLLGVLYGDQNNIGIEQGNGEIWFNENSILDYGHSSYSVLIFYFLS